MPVYLLIILIVSAYLLGSVPSSIWIGKLFYNTDVRNFGSKNSGATNTFRVLGIKAGLPVLIIDILKGYVAVILICFLNIDPETEQYILIQLLLGSCAFAGHVFPVFAGFNGGKGMSTLLGAVLAIHQYPVLISLGVFIIILLITRYVSLSSVIAGISYSLCIIFIFETTGTSVIIFSACFATAIIITHIQNIKRLLKKEEPKAGLSLKWKAIKQK